jgi:preprotein translocase subunit SecD
MTQNLQWRIILIGVVLAVSAFLVYPSVGPVPPFWAKYLPNNPVRLGLDLQGGLYLVLEVQADMAVEAVVDQSVSEASALMKEEKIRYNDIQRTSPTMMTVYLKDADQAGLFDEKVLDKLQNYKKASASQTDKGFEVQLQMDQKAAEIYKAKGR